MLPIKIDLDEIVGEFSLSGEETNLLGAAIIDRVVQEYYERWRNLVGSELSKSRQEYLKAMYIERTSPLEVVFGLSARESSLALMVEEGTPPFDEKPGLLASPKAKQKKNGGFYITVPFRHATPEAIAESGIFSSILPQDVYTLAKNSQLPLKREQLPINQQLPGSRKAINVPELKIPEYIHKAAKYEGLVKVEAASSDKERRSQYMTFRRVSDKSDPNSWFNGGITAKKLMDRALQLANISTVADMAIDETLERIFKER